MPNLQVSTEEAMEALGDLLRINPLAAAQFENIVLSRRLAEMQKQVEALRGANGAKPVEAEKVAES